MNSHPAWRGQRRVRVALELGSRATRVVGLSSLDGPAVQRATLEGTHVAQVTIDGTTAVIYSFDDPRLVRGVSRPKEIGHSYTRTDRAILHVDIPIPADGPAGPIAIRIADLSNVRGRPTDLDGVKALLDASPRSVRNVANVTNAQLIAHPDWASLRLPGTPAIPPTGHYEIFVDRSGKYRWRLRRPDGQIVADSGQGYRRRADCEADLRWIREHGTVAPIQSLDLE